MIEEIKLRISSNEESLIRQKRIVKKLNLKKLPFKISSNGFCDMYIVWVFLLYLISIAMYLSIFSSYVIFLNDSSNCFIKIDTQGYESQVLDGAINTLKKSKGILCELSLVPLYEGQHLWKEIIERFEKEGFVLWSLHKAFTDKRNGRTLQMDAVFLRENVI